MINSFTLSQLIEMSGDNRQGLMRECFTASSDNRMEIFRFPCRIDAFVIGVGTEGETSVSLNLHEYRLKKNSIFIFSPKNILQVKSEEYFRANVQGQRNRRITRFPAPHQHRHKKPAPAFPAIRSQPLPDAHARGKPLDTQFHRADRA